VLRTLGWAAAPLVALALCGVLPEPLRRWWWIVIHLWATFAFGIAVRSALSASRRFARCCYVYPRSGLQSCCSRSRRPYCSTLRSSTDRPWRR